MSFYGIELLGTTMVHKVFRFVFSSCFVFQCGVPWRMDLQKRKNVSLQWLPHRPVEAPANKSFHTNHHPLLLFSFSGTFMIYQGLVLESNIVLADVYVYSLGWHHKYSVMLVIRSSQSGVVKNISRVVVLIAASWSFSTSIF